MSLILMQHIAQCHIHPLAGAAEATEASQATEATDIPREAARQAGPCPAPGQYVGVKTDTEVMTMPPSHSVTCPFPGQNIGVDCGGDGV